MLIVLMRGEMVVMRMGVLVRDGVNKNSSQECETALTLSFCLVTLCPNDGYGNANDDADGHDNDDQPQVLWLLQREGDQV